MKKVNIILFIFLLIVVITSTVYFSFFYGKDNYNYDKYYETLDLVKNSNEFKDASTSEEFTIKAKKVYNKETENYAITVTLDNPRFTLRDVETLAYYKSESDNKNFPSLGLLTDSVDVYPSTNVNDKQREGITLSISTKTNVDTIYLYLSYLKDSERINKFYEVKVDVEIG